MIFIKTQNNGALINVGNCKTISIGQNNDKIVIAADEYIVGEYQNIDDANMVLDWIQDEISKKPIEESDNTKTNIVLFIPTIKEEQDAEIN